MGDEAKRMNYLTVDSDRHFYSKHRRICRSASPEARTTSKSCDEFSLEVPEVPAPTKVRRRSFLFLHKGNSSDSSTSSSLKSQKLDQPIGCTISRKQISRFLDQDDDDMYSRSRCYTDPNLKNSKLITPIVIEPPDSYSATTTPQSKRKHYVVNSGPKTLGSLLKQTLSLTTAPVGIKPSISEESLTQFSGKPLTKDVKKQFSRSTSSVSTLSYTQGDINSMAPLQTRPDAHSEICLNRIAKNDSSPEKDLQSKNQKRPYCQQYSLPESISTNYTTASSSTGKSSGNNLTTTLGNSKSEVKSLRQSANSLNPLVPVSSTSSIRSLSSNSSSTAKNDQNSAPTGSGGVVATVAAPTEKEKKRKEVSSSRVKKFHRHFSQVSKDEKLINYFSCALVSDILLQGHLYITDQHFAFYSNVFGYVTKVVIPTSSVTKISKEKTAKIIPNAVGVATADERHVFGSFISRESAFRLMCSVCPPMAPIAAEIVKSPAELEICEEYSIEDDSSCSISGNESPPQLTNGNALTPATATATAAPAAAANNDNKSPNSSEAAVNSLKQAKDIPRISASNANSMRTSTPDRAENAGLPTEFESPAGHLNESLQVVRLSSSSHAVSSSISSESQSQSTSSEPTTIAAGKSAVSRLDSIHKLSSSVCGHLAKLTSVFSRLTDLQLIYFGIVLAVVLSMFSFFLLYRVTNIEAKANLYGSPIDHPFHYRNDEDIFQEALRWQKELQKKSAAEAQSILESNLKQIAKVRRSLEALSMLIADQSDSNAGSGSSPNSNCN